MNGDHFLVFSVVYITLALSSTFIRNVVLLCVPHHPSILLPSSFVFLAMKTVEIQCHFAKEVTTIWIYCTTRAPPCNGIFKLNYILIKG